MVAQPGVCYALFDSPLPGAACAIRIAFVKSDHAERGGNFGRMGRLDAPKPESASGPDRTRPRPAELAPAPAARPAARTSETSTSTGRRVDFGKLNQRELPLIHPRVQIPGRRAIGVQRGRTPESSGNWGHTSATASAFRSAPSFRHKTNPRCRVLDGCATLRRAKAGPPEASRGGFASVRTRPDSAPPSSVPFRVIRSVEKKSANPSFSQGGSRSPDARNTRCAYSCAARPN